MALSGSFYKTIRSGYTFKVNWSATQDEANNRSTITLKSYLIANYSIYSSASKSGRSYVDGSYSSWSYSGFNGSGTYHLNTTTKTVDHNSDGTLTVDLRAWFDINVRLSGTYYGRQEASDRVTLDPIPRASSISNDRDWKAGGFFRINISRASSSFTHTARIYVNDNWIKTVSGIGYTKDVIFTTAENKDIFTQLNGAATGQSKVILETYKGSSYIGSKTYYGTVTAPEASATNSAFDHYVYTDQKIDIGLDVDLDDFTHKIVITLGNFTKTITGVGSSTSWTPSSSEQNSLNAEMPNDLYKSGNIAVYTYYEGVQIRETRNALLQFYIPSGREPVFGGSFSYKDTNSTTTAVTGNNQYIVQNKSDIQITLPSSSKASGKYGASIKKYIVTLNGVQKTANYSSSDIVLSFGSISSGSDVTASIKAIDSRGAESTISRTISILPYKNPKVNVSAKRLNNFESDTTISMSGSFSALTVGSVKKNSLVSMKYRYRQKGTGSYGSWKDFSFSTSGSSFTASNVSESLDNLKSWDLEVYVSDKLGSVSEVIYVASGQPVLFIDSKKRAVGINTFPTLNDRLEARGGFSLINDSWTTLNIKSETADTDAVLQLETPNGDWALRNDESDSNKMDFRWNNSTKFSFQTDGTVDLNGALNLHNNAIIAEEAGSTNIDHMYHDDASNAWHFVSDGSYKQEGNSTLVAGSIMLTSTGDVSASTASTRGITIGNPTSGSSLKMDTNEVSSFDDGGQSVLYLNPDGGDVRINSATSKPLLISDGELVNESYIRASLLNGWEHYGGGYGYVEYMKDKNGIVHLHGLTLRGDSGSDIFHLPSGYRPSQTEIHTVYTSGGGLGRVDIYDSGIVRHKDGSTGYVTLSGISFKAGN